MSGDSEQPWRSTAAAGPWLSHRVVVWPAFALLLICQVVFALSVRSTRPGVEEMPFPPSAEVLKVFSLGDDHLVFRAVARWLQGVGDGDGRVRPLVEYDYDRVVGWLKSIDNIDPQSEVIYFLATRYFGAVMEPRRGPAQVRRIAIYMRASALEDLPKRWPRLVWAGTRTLHVVKDKNFALQLAADFAGLEGRSDVPNWLPLLAVPLYRFGGDLAAAEALEADPHWIEIHRNSFRDLMQALGIPLKP